MFIYQVAQPELSKSGIKKKEKKKKAEKKRPHVECLFQSAFLLFEICLCCVAFKSAAYCDINSPWKRAELILPYQRVNYSGDLKPNPLFSCYTNKRPADKDHAPSAQSIVGGGTIKETVLINENKHP